VGPLLRIATVAAPCSFLLLACSAAAVVGQSERGLVDGESDHQGAAAAGSLRLGTSELCTATLLSPRVALTARHCVLAYGLHELVYSPADEVLPSMDPALEFAVTATRGHSTADLALLILSRPVDVEPIGVSTREAPSLVGAAVTLVGYGRTAYAEDEPRRRRGTSVVTAVDDEYIATGSQGVGTCVGDSGGPVLHEGQLVGVTSFGTGPCGQPTDYATRVDSHRDWLEQELGAVDPGWSAGGCHTAPGGGGGSLLCVSALIALSRGRARRSSRALGRPTGS
jgi:hypothetical protein